jgi:hypothetical protein
MKLKNYCSTVKAFTLTIALLCLALAIRASEKTAATPAKPSKAPTAVTNAPAAVREIPKSVFIMPTSPQEGKDPFFPKSTRLFTSVVFVPTTPTAKPLPIQLDLQLKGISGAADHRLAIIGTRTFEVGEEHEMGTGPGRVRVRCIEIKNDSVLIQIGDEQRVLHLRAGI